jgi:hypothetical protein
MRFHVPFDDVQFATALTTYRQMRLNLRALRRHFPPASIEAERLLNQYRKLIDEFGRQLARPRGRINPRRLNDLSELAVIAYVNYAARHY